MRVLSAPAQTTQQQRENLREKHSIKAGSGGNGVKLGGNSNTLTMQGAAEAIIRRHQSAPFLLLLLLFSRQKGGIPAAAAGGIFACVAFYQV